MHFPDLEVHAAWYAAEQGESLASTLRFVRSYMQHRERVKHIGLGASPMSIENYYRYVREMRRDFARG
ncbi:hypothetical protein [Fodinicola feengrottensis]|uniref:Uncharacterized protein n=1 Tax=Fodinicola feengrottensis TaxID=435914 RepID=A0ABP4U9L3_9ACTN|nr:hypothetical protein [Fodinicola feengrottensis]